MSLKEKREKKDFALKFGLTLTKCRTIEGIVSPIGTPTPKVAVVAAPKVQVAVTPMDHVLALLPANNVPMQSLPANAKGVSDAINHFQNGLDLPNTTNGFLKNSVLDALYYTKAFFFFHG
ncbi:hypothetical protein PHYBLDRAFT_166539 [Phycomyces blakesleeanus NRRL 1555(-)]|uniref:Uncharacterized protein n=1 Tax=Phycomyces blakesleeanus (strain ATCC 8743b / DSM 1359 / FGSC 10004 / NBRC 33097 / NRRL 1555) TaxID=763407 RepID=A0A167N821_PHYB8|nr:hypothetical protein PHYBLDRAFT_166539 [Phycomyces blakesleeanus NRRL 1555(-)]OAD75280.1 hypothetical protein PHYBLDRAFT_166539 [Phycomyces blakesleeanus NRRL 1555(-)]|eukprot:XP_018293320.1 hypothetical protein PHYBLDRAFT_166539 [Phycomyces blakesleeanus NRRL 1555(-)]